MSTITTGNKITVSVPPRHILAVSADDGSSGNVWSFAERPGDTPGVTQVTSGNVVLLGPHTARQSYLIETIVGALTYSTAPASFAEAGKTVAAINPPAGFVELFGEGAPVASAQASKTINPDGDDNALFFSAVEYGEAGNAITVEYRAQEAAEAPLSVEVNGKAIIVHLEMDASEIVSTAADVLAAIEASEAASALVTVEASDTDEDAGSSVGVVTAVVPTALADGAGVGIGSAGKGSRYTDYDTPGLYINTGDAEQPVWVEMAQVE